MSTDPPLTSASTPATMVINTVSLKARLPNEQPTPAAQVAPAFDVLTPTNVRPTGSGSCTKTFCAWDGPPLETTRV